MGRSRWRPSSLQHQGDHQGGGQRSPRRHPRPGGLRLRPHVEPSHQGGKGCGVYYPIFTLV